jgi:ABC-type branched-subunit amino acid transport system substrate-binding protein
MRCIAGAVAVAWIGIATPPAASQGGGEEPTATEIGVTADEIRIAVIAEVDNPVVPGLFVGAKDAVEAWGEYINKQGGLAGRKVVVDFIDSKLSADAARDAVIQACEEDFAIVGTHMLFLNNIAPLVDCTDMAGTATGLPDVAAFQTSFDHQCSPVSYTVSGTIMDCATKDQHPQTYRAAIGYLRYLKKKFKLTTGSWLAANDIKGALDATLPLMEAERANLGLEGENFLVSGVAPQTTFTPYVQSLAREGVEAVVNWSACDSLINAQNEALAQGVEVEVYASTTACYDKDYLEQEAAEGTFVWLPYLPIEDGGASKAVQTMVKAIGKDKIDGFAILAWQSALLFRDAVNQLVEAEGVNALTRANLLETFTSMTSFDADGTRGENSPGERTGSGCFVVMKVQNGKFVREFPKQKGKLSCGRNNYVEVEYDNES